MMMCIYFWMEHKNWYCFIFSNNRVMGDSSNNQKKLHHIILIKLILTTGSITFQIPVTQAICY